MKARSYLLFFLFGILHHIRLVCMLMVLLSGNASLIAQNWSTQNSAADNTCIIYLNKLKNALI